MMQRGGGSAIPGIIKKSEVKCDVKKSTLIFHLAFCTSDIAIDCVVGISSFLQQKLKTTNL